MLCSVLRLCSLNIVLYGRRYAAYNGASKLVQICFHWSLNSVNTLATILILILQYSITIVGFRNYLYVSCDRCLQYMYKHRRYMYMHVIAWSFHLFRVGVRVGCSTPHVTVNMNTSLQTAYRSYILLVEPCSVYHDIAYMLNSVLGMIVDMA
jgi:hypothetical protein